MTAITYESPDGSSIRCQFALIRAAGGRADVLRRSDSPETIARARRRAGVTVGEMFYRGDRASGSVIELDGRGRASQAARYYVRRWRTWTGTDGCSCGGWGTQVCPRPGPGYTETGWGRPHPGLQARAYLATPARKADARLGRRA
jgi:hypothetical protein